MSEMSYRCGEFRYPTDHKMKNYTKEFHVQLLTNLEGEVEGIWLSEEGMNYPYRKKKLYTPKTNLRVSIGEE